MDLWGHARTHGLILVTKDADFAELSLLRGSPPLVLWVRRGNCSTATLAALLLRHRAAVEA